MMAPPLPQPGPCIGCAPHLQTLEPAVHPSINVLAFAHLVCTHANAVKFAHQSLGNLKISTLLKATRRGFLKWCPTISETLILKYLNPSCTTAKGHMKHPHHCIRSTWPKPLRVNPIHIPVIPAAPLQPTAQLMLPVLPLFVEIQPYPGPAYDATACPNLIGDDDNERYSVLMHLQTKIVALFTTT
jgi:hypothetical protein